MNARQRWEGFLFTAIPDSGTHFDYSRAGFHRISRKSDFLRMDFDIVLSLVRIDGTGCNNYCNYLIGQLGNNCGICMPVVKHEAPNKSVV